MTMKKDWHDLQPPEGTLTMAHFAWSFAEYAHRGQKRKDGSHYFDHPCRVAALVRHFKGDSHEIEALCAAAYLHDTLEDTDTTYYDLVKAFGYQVASIVLELTTNPDMKAGIGNKYKYLSFKCKHMTSWALVIKLCDRLDNLSDTKGCTPEWIDNYIMETAHILGYILFNRELTPTHRAIIEVMWEVVFDAADARNLEVHQVFQTYEKNNNSDGV
jgi:(p)ppGpp synthase/HD superfamily hydrolase